MVVGFDTVATSTDAVFKLDLTILDVRDSKADEGIFEVSTDALIAWCFSSLENKSRFVKELVICLSELTDRLTTNLSGNARTYEELEETKNVANDSTDSVDLNCEDVDVVKNV